MPERDIRIDVHLRGPDGQPLRGDLTPEQRAIIGNLPDGELTADLRTDPPLCTCSNCDLHPELEPVRLPVRLPAITTARPGDTVIVLFAQQLSAAHADAVGRRLSERHPDLTWGVIDSCNGAIVIPGSDDTDLLSCPTCGSTKPAERGGIEPPDRSRRWPCRDGWHA